MAKPLGAKSIIIRDAIKAHPKKGNTEIAELINDSHDRMDDKIKVTPQDIAQQKQAMKKGGGKAPAAAEPAAESEAPVRAKPGRPKGSGGRPKKAVEAPRAVSGSPVELIDRTFSLANECGGISELKRLVDRLAGV